MMQQFPAPGIHVLHWRGDSLKVQLKVDAPLKGRAVLRTDLNGNWEDLPLRETSPGVFAAEFLLARVGVFSGKCCFLPSDGALPIWPEGENFRLKVSGAVGRSGNSIYTVFLRQFGSFRAVARHLDMIMDTMGFDIVQTLPPFPVPESYAKMGEYGCPFAALDLFSVDPSMAEFDGATTPLDQFRELVEAVHARGGDFFIDLPANHTGWGSTLQTHHPEWFKRDGNGNFHSPGAWGVVWADLVELDYAHEELAKYMAEVFLFWCRFGIDGFRCDAGYMLPVSAWQTIVDKVRAEYPETIFMLEGLGGDPAVTDRLLGEVGLDWAYSEIFQNYTRDELERYLPSAFTRGETLGTLVNFAETHDNDRLSKGGQIYVQLRVKLAALLSQQGAWGIANGVEWYADEKIDVHGKNELKWGNPENCVELIARLNRLLNEHPSYCGLTTQRVITRGGGNVLAVLRTSETGGLLLVMANLDCQRSATINYDHQAFPFAAAHDLLTGKEVQLSSAIALAPGEVLLLEALPAQVLPPQVTLERSLFEIVLPRDENRVVPLPPRSEFTISANFPLRAKMVDPETGKTLAFDRSNRGRMTLIAPDYIGSGTVARKVSLKVSVYERGEVAFYEVELAIAPPLTAAKMLLALAAPALRKAPATSAVLIDGIGAVAQVRAEWGRVFSRYDAILSANPNRNAPADRLNLWTRMRCWLQYGGYSWDFKLERQTEFLVAPDGSSAIWRYELDVGAGHYVAMELALSLPEENMAVLEVRRLKATGLEAEGKVQLVFRPDLEWRSFHGITKAYAGSERDFPKGIMVQGDGFTFSPYARAGSFRMRSCEAQFHLESEWTYNLDYPVEAERGLEAQGDVFSPGWFLVELELGGKAKFIGEYLREGEKPHAQVCPRPDLTARSMPLFEGLEQALAAYIVRRGNNKTVIAGYPWFLDWGRDTFIFLRAIIAVGRYREALGILKEFAAFEEAGTLPNIIYGETSGNRDTVDAQLWFVRCVMEMASAGALSTDDFVALRKVAFSIVDNYLKGTPNGIAVDEESMLVRSPAHFTWMDTNYPACTPRAGYAVEIQALWISALKFVARFSEAAQALASVQRYFASPKGYADCLEASHGESAALAKADFSLRPNQLLLVSLGILNDPTIVQSCAQLLLPGAIRSLSASDRGYCGVYSGDEDTARKPAYHNGTAWGWQFPLWIEAAFVCGKLSREEALSLLSSAVNTVNAGAIGHAPEIVDGNRPHLQKGCWAQAWSDGELVRVYKALIASVGTEKK